MQATDFKQAFQFYPTTPELVKEVWSIYEYSDRRGSTHINLPGEDILDPSGGKGHLVEPLQNPYLKCQLFTYELDHDLQAILRDKDITILGSDFLQATTPLRFDIVVMNPPFRYGGRACTKGLGASTTRRTHTRHLECRDYPQSLHFSTGNLSEPVE